MGAGVSLDNPNELHGPCNDQSTGTHTFAPLPEVQLQSSQWGKSELRQQEEGKPMQEWALWSPRVPRKQGAQGAERHVMLAGGEQLGPRALTLLELLKQRI